MTLSTLTAINPIDGRYGEKTAELRPYFSEFGLIYYRVYVEIRWFQFLASQRKIKELPALGDEENNFLEKLIVDFDESMLLPDETSIEPLHVNPSTDYGSDD